MTQVQSSPPPDVSSTLPRLVPRARRAPASREPASGPAPPTPALPAAPSLEGHVYVRPSRRILSPEDHQLFLKSETCGLVEAFVYGIADSVRDRAVSSVKEAELTETIKTVLDIIAQADKVLDKCPPEDTGSRFGNPVFRTFLDEIETALPSWHAQLGLTSPTQVDEIATYLLHSFGNKRRIDYGSGHELNFFLWLLCLNRLGRLPPPTFPALALVVLPAYLRLMRRIQEAYYLEPAGSHGVWGLDDYQFLPFLFGAAQLLHHPYITPKSIHNALVLEEEGKDYLYLDQISFVNSVKNVEGLRWHSPMLDDISAARNWGKIEGGMRKMFRKEILEKLPVMQHFLFGSLVPAVPGMSTEDEAALEQEDDEAEGGEVKVFDDAAGKRHVHANAGWGDCCGIRVPAAVGAEGEARKGGARALRRVPFD
jgi:serine/threonine-protein phosphatase 2A activator